MTIILNGKTVEAYITIKGRLVIKGTDANYVINEDPIGDDVIRKTTPFRISEESLSIEDSGGPFSGVTSPVFIDGPLITITLL